MHIVWDQKPRETWDQIHANAAGALQQDWAYGAAVQSIGGQVHRAAVIGDDGAILAIAQFVYRGLLGLTGALCNRGPVFAHGLSRDQKKQIIAALKRSFPAGLMRVILMMPEEEAGPAPAIANWRKVATGGTIAELDLTQSADTLRQSMHVKWRNRLSKAERSAQKPIVSKLTQARCRWLLAREADQRKARGYRALPLAFTPAFIDAKTPKRAGLLVQTFEANEPSAAMLFLVHGKTATYHIGWTSAAGRQQFAHQLLMWESINVLKDWNIDRLDLGGVNTGSGAGIARFKLGTGAATKTFSGTYI